MLVTYASQVMFAQTPPTHVTGDWLVDMRTIAAVGGVVLLGTWRIGRWMSKIDNRMDVGERRFDNLETRMNHRDARLDRIEKILDGLPCVDRTHCEKRHEQDPT